MTELTDNIARVAKLRSLMPRLNENDKKFANGMCDRHEQRNHLSSKQWLWIDRLTVKADNADAFGKDSKTSFLPIADLFAAACESASNPKGLKCPKMRFDLAGIDPIWRGDLLLRRAGEGSQYTGAINVTNGLPYADPFSVFYGRIHKDGRFERSLDCTDQVVGLLTAINTNPAEIAANYGKKTGQCCFCNSTLSDERSTDVGYGPVCADRFNLPWG